MWRVQFQNGCVPEVLKSQQLVALESSGAASLVLVDGIVDGPASAPSRSITSTTFMYFFIIIFYTVRLHDGEKLSSQLHDGEKLSSQRETDEEITHDCRLSICTIKRENSAHSNSILYSYITSTAISLFRSSLFLRCMIAHRRETLESKRELPVNAVVVSILQRE
jgi:hypothetical protein